jgi:hypothetical protein
MSLCYFRPTAIEYGPCRGSIRTSRKPVSSIQPRQSARCESTSQSGPRPDWVEEIDEGHPQLKAYRARLLAHPVVARAVDEARAYRPLFPLGAPDRD